MSAGSGNEGRRAVPSPPERGLIDVLAHELRTPLAAILGYQELMTDGIYGPLPSGVEDAVARIGRSARQLLALVDGLDLVDAPAPARTVGAPPSAVSPVLAELAPGVEEEAQARGLEVEVAIPSVELRVRCDAVTLRSVLELLLGALFKSAASGSFTLRAAAGADGSVQFLLANTPLEELDAPATASAVRTGAGLRVLIARRLAEQVGGDVRLESSGTLRVTLPGAGPALH